MKKTVVTTILVTAVLILQTGCANRPSLENAFTAEPLLETTDSQDASDSAGSSDGENQHTPETADPSAISSSPEESGIYPRDLETIKTSLSGYPDDPDELAATDSYVIMHGQQYSGAANWESFYRDVQNGNPAELVLIQFTVEGDAILSYLNYDGSDFYLVTDYSRDAFAGDSEKYREAAYPYLKIFDNTAENGDYERLLVLTVDENLSAQKYTEQQNSGTQGEFKTTLLAWVFLGNEHAVLTGTEAWHDVCTKFDESALLIPEDSVAKIEVLNGSTGERITLENGDAFQAILSRYKTLDIQPDESLASRSGYACLLRLFDAEGILLQTVIPYKDGVQINGTFYDGSMNGTSTQLLQKLASLFSPAAG